MCVYHVSSSPVFFSCRLFSVHSFNLIEQISDITSLQIHVKFYMHRLFNLGYMCVYFYYLSGSWLNLASPEAPQVLRAASLYERQTKYCTATVSPEGAVSHHLNSGFLRAELGGSFWSKNQHAGRTMADPTLPQRPYGRQSRRSVPPITFQASATFPCWLTPRRDWPLSLMSCPLNRKVEISKTSSAVPTLSASIATSTARIHCNPPAGSKGH